MKSLLLISALLLNGYISFSQSLVKEINKSLAKVNESLYASDSEVSNAQYNLFLADLKKNNKQDLLALCQIDSVQWENKSTYNQPYVKYYHAHPAYKNYPVVNISHKAATLFCEWLTGYYNSDPKRKFKKVIFRLPTEQEWIQAAQAGDANAIYAWQGTELRNKKGQLMANFKRGDGDTLGVAGHLNENADITVPVYSYWPNKFDIFTMSGNVSEMLNEKEIIKGGSWANTSDFLRIDTKIKYDGSPKPYIGFRYFMEIIEK